MLPTNVMSFMKKMVATDETQTTQQSQPTDAGGGGGGTFGKLKQTLSSSLLTAQDKVNKMSPRPSLVPTETSDTSYSSDTTQQSNNNNNNNNNTTTSSTGGIGNKQEPGRRSGSCRVCLKSFKPDDYHKTCFECQQRVCEDCASYSKLDENEDINMWRCSVCRRKMASRVCIQQDSTDSMLDVPVLEALQRRHSDVKLGSTTNLSPGNGVSALAPPRSPELRRHSDVSPASLKELEKLKGGAKTPGGDMDWRRGGRSVAPSRSNSPPHCDFELGGQQLGSMAPPISRMASRRGSRVSRQHSYDDDIKAGGGPNPAAPGVATNELGLGMPAIPRRKSAYDVFAPGVLQAAQQVAALTAASRQTETIPIVGVQPPSRRPSFRVPIPNDDMPNQEDSPLSPETNPSILAVEEDRRMRRRGSQLPDISALRDRGAIPPTQLNPVPPPLAAFTGPNLEDLEAPRRQTSMDGEAIKIVIHDVDSGPICASKRRVVLRRDPTDKAHRTRGFGMRVVGGKTGADGRLFAYIVWTVPGGPAEKGGLQQGDKILEWNGVSLIDRSFEEVCSIMDRTGDIVELLVEHATDFRMCDLLDENLPPGASGSGHQSGARKSGDGPVSLGLQAEPEVPDKSPSSPTRRKLPKTPEQIAREKQVTGRVQLQVWYHGERSELVVSLMAADDLAPRDEGHGHGSLPEAYAKVRILPRTGDGSVAQTEVSRPTQNPIWNATLTFGHIAAENLMDRYIEIQLWDLVPHTESIFLGECNVELQKAFLEDRALWCRLEDPKGLRACSISKSTNVSPRGSLVSADISRLIRRCDYTQQRSISDDVDSIGDGTSLLHPDHAYIAGSRRGSSQSEQLEVEVYQLGRDFSRSLPGSRRSSFQDRDENKDDDMMPPASYMSGRRRSSVARRDPDEILRSLKQVRGELGRAMSLAGAEPKRQPSRRASHQPISRKESIVNFSELLPIGIGTNATSPPSDDETINKAILPKWKGSGQILANRKQSIAMYNSNLRAASSVTNVSKINPTTQFQQMSNYTGGSGIGTCSSGIGSNSLSTNISNQLSSSGTTITSSTASLLRKMSISERKMSQIDLKMLPLERKLSTAERKMSTSERKLSTCERKMSTSERKMSIAINSKLFSTSPSGGTGSISSGRGTGDGSGRSGSGSDIILDSLGIGTCGSSTLNRKMSTYDRKLSISDRKMSTSERKLSTCERKMSTLGIGLERKMSTIVGDHHNRKMSTIVNMTLSNVKLGPYQLHPKGYRLTAGRYGELKLGLLKIKGTVELEVIAAKNIVPVDCETPPDTYVKCYVKDGDRLRHKKKTRIIRHSSEPIYKQSLKYQSSDVFGRNLVITVWQRCVGFEHNKGLGGAELNLDKIVLAQHISGWYPLFPMHSFGGSDSDNSP